MLPIQCVVVYQTCILIIFCVKTVWWFDLAVISNDVKVTDTNDLCPDKVIYISAESDRGMTLRSH